MPNTRTKSDDLDILWGVSAIAAYIRRDKRQAYYLISKKRIPAKKHGARLISARKSEIDRALSVEAA